MSTELTWFKSSHSDGEGAECVEVALSPRRVHIRDSKRSGAGVSLSISPTAWAGFIATIRSTG
ncbi:DUF397 domain-containing protein [Streptomyces sp. NPDC049577]|uniref:DUF397 domain-containing protein n=1 Tax=Streptomyces sp. NPDC049577 TaxID=3155153 RepID=UPI003412725D